MRDKLSILSSVSYVGFFVTICIAIPAHAHGEEASDLQKELLYSEQKIEEQKKHLQEKRATVSSLEEEVELYVASLKLKQEKLIQTEQEIEVINDEAEIVKSDIVATKQQHARVVRALEKAINEQKKLEAKNIFEQLLSADSFSSFYNQQVATSAVVEEVGKLTAELRVLQSQLKNQQESVELKRIELENAILAQEAQLEEINILASNAHLNLETAEYDVQKITEHLERVRVEQVAIENALQQVVNENENREFEKDPSENLDHGDFSMQWPVDQHSVITCDYLCSDYPYSWAHAAIDIAVPSGTPVHAAEDGIVSKFQFDGTSLTTGWVYIDHGNNIETVYLHLRSIVVEPYEKVAKGELIGYSGGAIGEVGAGPYTKGPHLHFEVRAGGLPTNPHYYLP